MRSELEVKELLFDFKGFGDRTLLVTWNFFNDLLSCSNETGLPNLITSAGV